jgi:uncharacterized membrane-anchored protein
MPRIRRSNAVRLEPLAAKVPEITLIFWVAKLVSTGMGEAMSDFLGSVNVPLAGLIGIAGMWIALRLQLNSRRYEALKYWFAVMMVAIFGTMAADAVHDGTSLPYPVTTALYAILTAAVFYSWYRSEGTLSIHTIDTRKRERFYWGAVLCTFALGTAAGDMTATAFNIGYFGSVLLFAGIIAIPAIGWARFRMNPILSFWFAYVITRPVGASFADWFSKPHSITGLDFGDGHTSLVTFVAFAAIVAYLAIAKRDIQPAPGEARAERPWRPDAHARAHPHPLDPHLDPSIDGALEASPAD